MRLIPFLVPSVLLLSSFTISAEDNMNILPLGDSITDGSAFDTPNGSGGYRGVLQKLLKEANLKPDFAGSTTINSEELEDKEHEGHSGWRIDELHDNIEQWNENYPQLDYVLVHIGTNDFGQGFETETAIDRLSQLIERIAKLQPESKILVSNLLEREEPRDTALQAQFNAKLPAVIEKLQAADAKVHFVDLRAAVPLSDMPDQLHPNQEGYEKMAAAWAEAILALEKADAEKE